MATALQHGTITVGTSAITLFEIPSGIRRARVKVFNNDATNKIFIGDGTVTSAGVTQGYPVLANSHDDFDFVAGTKISVIATAPTSVSYLWTAGM